MRSQNVEILNSDGSHHRWVCQAEADRLVDKGDVVRTSRRKDPAKKYRLKPMAEPSTSQISMAALTRHDTELLACLRRGSTKHVPVERLERLAGWGLIPIPAESEISET
jgi:hypothetical protein